VRVGAGGGAVPARDRRISQAPQSAGGRITGMRVVVGPASRWVVVTIVNVRSHAPSARGVAPGRPETGECHQLAISPRMRFGCRIAGVTAPLVERLRGPGSGASGTRAEGGRGCNGLRTGVDQAIAILGSLAQVGTSPQRTRRSPGIVGRRHDNQPDCCGASCSGRACPPVIAAKSAASSALGRCWVNRRTFDRSIAGRARLRLLLRSCR